MVRQLTSSLRGRIFNRQVAAWCQGHRPVPRSQWAGVVETGFVLLPVAGAMVGLLLRRFVSKPVATVLLGVGVSAAVVAVASLGVAVMGWAPFGSLTHGVIAVFCLAVAACLIPMGLTAGYGRSSRAGRSA